MIYSLVCHADYPSKTVDGVEVEVNGGDDDVLLSYRVRCAGRLLMPEWKRNARADGLWRTTCFEMFLRANGDDRYVEFNFSPSTEWAAYAFSAYRQGMRELERDVDPFIERLIDGIEVDCDLGGLPKGGLQLGLSAVIEETDGTKSYWALAHPPGPPDFHDPACFIATLPAPGSP